MKKAQEKKRLTERQKKLIKMGCPVRMVMATKKEMDNCICSEYDGRGYSTCGIPCPIHSPSSPAHDIDKRFDWEKELDKLWEKGWSHYQLNTLPKLKTFIRKALSLQRTQDEKEFEEMLKSIVVKLKHWQIPILSGIILYAKTPLDAYLKDLLATLRQRMHIKTFRKETL